MSVQKKNRRTQTVRFSPDNQVFLDERKKLGVNYTDTVNLSLDRFRENGLQPEEEIIEYQECDSRDEIPAQYGKFVKCKKKGLTIKEEKCKKCRYHKINKELLMTKEQLERGNQKLREEKPKLREDIQGLLDQKRTLTAEVQELDANTRKQIVGLKEQVKRAYDLLEEKNTYVKNANGKMSEKNQCINYLESFIEPNGNLHRVERTVKDKEPLQTSQQIPEKAVESQRLVERVTEKEKVEKEKVTETFQQPQEPKMPSEDLQVECPNTGKKVSFKDVCHTCPDFMTCSSYGEAVMMNKVLGRQ